MCIEAKQQSTISARNALFLCIVVAVYSLSGIFTKQASTYEFLSIPYLGCLLGVILVFAAYAVLWQMILKRVPLSVAYPFRSLGVVYGLAIAGFAFHEPVTWQNMFGGAIVIFGLYVMMTGK